MSAASGRSTRLGSTESVRIAPPVLSAVLFLFAALSPAFAQTTADYRCVIRTDEVRPPQLSMPSPVKRGRGDDGDDDHDRRDQTGFNPNSGQLTSQGRPAGLHFSPVCPEGQVPISIRPIHHGPKGNPLFASDSANEIFQAADRRQFVRDHLLTFDEAFGQPGEPNPPTPTPLGPACDGRFWYGECFYYGAAGFARVADGAAMTQSIERPVYVNIAGPSKYGHSLDEIAVMDSPSIFNVVELGWFVSTDVYGDPDPHIFVYHWIQGQETCYDDCGWHQFSNTYYPRQNLGAAVGKQVYVGYVYYQGNWWAWFDDQWMGYFPGSIWSGAFTKSALIEWFGEVASLNGIPPQTQMGNGQFPSSTSAASMSTLCDVDAVAWVCWYRDLQALAATPPNPKYYDIEHTGFGATRYGGPGQ